MGPPLSSLFKNLVLEDLEIECMNKLKQKYDCEPKCYFRCVDDTFLCIKKHEFNHVVKVFNEYERNLKFTFEIESNEKINYLDLVIHRTNNVLSTN